MTRTAWVLAAMLALGLAPAASAQTFPERTVKIIVPTAPGGSIDTTARVVANKLSEKVAKTTNTEKVDVQKKEEKKEEKKDKK